MVKQLTPTPGRWLHEAVMGALKGRGKSLEDWCSSNDMNSQTLRSYTFGQNGGAKSALVLDRIIDDAGRDVVLALYKHRLEQEARQFGIVGIAA